MGQRFSYDFSHVRVHAGTEAEQSARDVNALAYTVGNDIVFGAGEFSPATQEGRRLLAHEFTHVVQQHGAVMGVQRKDDGTGKAPYLIDIEKVGAVWGRLVYQIAGKMKLSIDDPKVRAKAGELTVIQIGPTNFKRWKDATGGGEGITLEPETQAETEKRLEEESVSLTTADGLSWSPQGMAAQFGKMADDMALTTMPMREDVARMERAALKLKTPDGGEGKVYQYGGGAVSTIVGPTAGALSKVAAFPVQKVVSAVQGKKDNSSFGSIGEDMVTSAVSSYQLTTGDLNERYEQTRPSYKRFMAEVAAFETARQQLKSLMSLGRDVLGDSLAEYEKLEAAKKEMREAYNEYAGKIEQLGIPAKAKQLERAIDDTAEGVMFTLESVAIPGGGAMSKEGQALLKEGERALEEVGLGVAKGTSKEVLKDTARVGTEVLKSGEDAAIAQNMSRRAGINWNPFKGRTLADFLPYSKTPKVTAKAMFKGKPNPVDFLGLEGGKGGRIWVSTDAVTHSHVDDLANQLLGGPLSSGKPVEIITGTHGSPAGSMSKEFKFLIEDYGIAPASKNVTIHNAATMTDEELRAVLESGHEVILGWCDSQFSRRIHKALGLNFMNAPF